MMDFSRKIQRVVQETDCSVHPAPAGFPCFSVRMDSREGYYAGVCGKRALKLFTGRPLTKFQKEKR